jgi:hypothetical protein
VSSDPINEDDWFKRHTDAKAGLARIKGVPDGVFSIVAYNWVHVTGWPRKPGPYAIDPFKVFSDEPADVVEMWVRRANKLLGSNDSVGEAVVAQSPNLPRLKERFVAANPGFNEESYDYAIYLGAAGAR